MVGGQRRRLDTGQGVHAIDHRGQEAVVGGKRGRGLLVEIPRGRQLELGFQHRTDVETWAGMCEMPEASDQQAGADGQHHGERHFNDHQRTAQAAMAAAGCPT